MKWLKKGLIVGGVVVVGFGLLRVYGAYQNEQGTALVAVAQLREAGKAIEAERAEDAARRACKTSWLNYNLKEAQARIIRSTKGEVAYLREEVRISGDKPTCLEPDTSLSGILQSTETSLDLIDKEYRYWYLMVLQQRYASDRKLQTRHILHRVWGTLIGAVPETQEAWFSFLAKNYPDVKFGKEEPKF